METDDRGRRTVVRCVVIDGRGDRPVAPTVAASQILRALRSRFFGADAPQNDRGACVIPTELTQVLAVTPNPYLSLPTA